MTIFSKPSQVGNLAASVGLSLCSQATAAPPVLDPALLMQGTPPAPAYRVDIGNWQAFPQKVWSFQHARELFPTRQIARGGAVTALPAARVALDRLNLNPAGSPPMTWDAFLKETHTDAIVVLQRGRIVEERYFNGMSGDTAHLMFSASKSMTGLMAAVLIAEGKLDEGALVGSLVPELAGSAWAGATVRQVLDMTDGVKFTEIYTDPASDVFRYVGSMGWAPQLRQQGTPEGILAMLPTLKAVHEEPRGSAFRYRSPATDVVAWVAQRASGLSLSKWMEQRLWRKMGMEQDAYTLLDPTGQEVTFAGMNASARDLARLGQLLLQRGKWKGEQLIPAAVADDLARGGSTKAFQAGGFATRAGWSYRSQWWVNPGSPRSFGAHGAFGQMLYVYPDDDVVVVKLSSHPNPVSATTDPIHQRAMAALLAHLRASGR